MTTRELAEKLVAKYYTHVSLESLEKDEKYGEVFIEFGKTFAFSMEDKVNKMEEILIRNFTKLGQIL